MGAGRSISRIRIADTDMGCVTHSVAMRSVAISAREERLQVDSTSKKYYKSGATFS